MKGFLAFVFLIVAVCAAPPSPQGPPPPQEPLAPQGPPLPQELIHIPQKCDDVFSVKVCDKIKSMQESLKLQTEAAKEAFIDAYKKGKKTYTEVIQSVEDFYLEKIKSKKCEDFVSADTCIRLELLGQTLSIKYEEFQVFVKKAVAEGNVKAAEVYDKVVDYYRNNIKGKKCEDFLKKTPQVCTAVRKAATALKVKAEEWEKVVRELVLKGYTDVKTVVKTSIQKVKDLAANTKCEDLLNPSLCAALRDYAVKAKVAFPKIMSTVRDLLASGVKVVKGFLSFVYKITDTFIDCEHVFTPASCELLKKKIAVVGGTISDFGRAVREIATKVITKASKIYETVLEFTKSKMCKYLGLGCPSHNAISKRSIGSLSEIWKKYKDMFQKGIAAAKAKLQESLKQLLESGKALDETVRDILKEIVNKSTAKYKELKELMKKIIDAATGKGNNTTADVTKTKRDLRQKLKDALSKANVAVKAVIEKLLLLSQEKLKEIHVFILNLLKKIGVDTKTKREIDEVDVLESAAETLVNAETEILKKQAEEIAEDLIDNAITELEDNEDIQIQSSLQKRDLTRVVDKLKQVFGKVGDKVKEVLAKLKSTSVEDIKNALKKAGVKLIGVAEDIYKKIKEALEKQES